MQNEERARPVNFYAGRDGKEHDWGRLPLYAIERILFFLNLHDRSQASIVCKSWGEAFECPDLWRSPVLIFSKGNCSKPCFNPQSVVERFGRGFQKLAVCCRNERRRNRKHMFEMLSNFFHSMEIEGVQLEGFRMPRLMVIAKNIDSTQVKVSEKVIDFLRSQTCLASVNFSDGRIYHTAGLEILESLVAENVHHLMLQNFFDHSLAVSRSSRFMSAICRFHHLRSLSINYEYLTGGVLTCLAVSLEGHLEFFDILIVVSEIFSFISDDSWGFLLNKCPQLQVHVKIELDRRRSVQNELPHLLYPALPLKSLQCVMRRTWERNNDDFIFHHIADNFHHTLKEVEFDFHRLHEESFQSSLVAMVKNCPLLENLTVRVRYPYFSADQLFNGMLAAISQLMNDNGIVNMKRFRVTLRGLTIERRQMRQYLTDRYVQRFKELGVQLKMKMKK